MIEFFVTWVVAHMLLQENTSDSNCYIHWIGYKRSKENVINVKKLIFTLYLIISLEYFYLTLYNEKYFRTWKKPTTIQS